MKHLLLILSALLMMAQAIYADSYVIDSIDVDFTNIYSYSSDIELNFGKYADGVKVGQGYTDRIFRALLRFPTAADSNSTYSISSADSIIVGVCIGSLANIGTADSLFLIGYPLIQSGWYEGLSALESGEDTCGCDWNHANDANHTDCSGSDLNWNTAGADGEGTDRGTTKIKWWDGDSWEDSVCIDSTNWAPGDTILIKIPGTELSNFSASGIIIIQSSLISIDNTTYFRLFSDEAITDFDLKPFTIVYFSADACDPPPSLESASADSILSDFSGEQDYIWRQFHFPDTAMSNGYAVLRASTTAYQDSSADTTHVAFQQNTPFRDTITISVTETDTVRFTGWLYDATADCWSPRIEWYLALVDEDTQAPDVHDAFNIDNWVSAGETDLVSITVGAVDSLDFDTTIIRYGTSIPTSITDGSLLWTGGALENNTANYNLTADSGMVYFVIFGGDEVDNWNEGVSDSLFMPGVPVGGIKQNGMFQIMMDKNRSW